MQCTKCGTENKAENKFCKICGEPLVKAEETVPAGKAEGEKAAYASEGAEAPAVNASPSATREDLHGKTSPLAVRMQEKYDRADKKLKKKLKRGKVWACIAIVMSLLFILENALVISYELGLLEQYLGASAPNEETEENTQKSEIQAPPVEPEEPVGAKRYEGLYTYNYHLVKNYDEDLSGNYSVVTEEILSSGTASLVSLDGESMALTVIPGEMTVDGQSVALGATPEAFSARLSNNTVSVQMKGTEQKFFAPGGAEPVVLSLAMTEEDGISAYYTVTYDKTVGTMNMRYTLSVSLLKQE